MGKEMAVGCSVLVLDSHCIGDSVWQSMYIHYGAVLDNEQYYQMGMQAVGHGIGLVRLSWLSDCSFQLSATFGAARRGRSTQLWTEYVPRTIM